MDIQQEIKKIHNRNQKVEADKAWETSITRKALIAIFTYIVIVIFFWVANLPRPFINAIVPTIGFIVSTLSIKAAKNIWLKHYYNQNK